MKLPNKILKCPIIDTVIEIRFNSKINPNAIFGIIYNNLKKEYPKVETLPILQIPEQLREKDPVFKYKPFYKISDGKYSLQIGYDVIAFGSVMPYPGWTMIETKFYKNIKQILASDIID
ncbi:MAG: TIGR04255 family protein, partial [Bacteroidota bacterium]